MFGFLHISDRKTSSNSELIRLGPVAKNEIEGPEAMLIISQIDTTGLARDFNESVDDSVDMLGDQVANMFYCHARQNCVDPRQLTQGVEKFCQGLRGLLGSGAHARCEGTREKARNGPSRV